MSHVGLLDAVGVVLALVVVGVGKSLLNGHLREAITDARAERSSAKKAHDQIPVLVEKVDDVQEEVEKTRQDVAQTAEKVDAVGRVVAILHAEDDEVRQDELRERLDVDAIDYDLVDPEAEPDP